MKVVRSGYLLFDRKRLIIIGWMFDCEGEAVNIDKMLDAIFRYIKKEGVMGLDSNKFSNVKKS